MAQIALPDPQDKTDARIGVGAKKGARCPIEIIEVPIRSSPQRRAARTVERRQEGGSVRLLVEQRIGHVHGDVAWAVPHFIGEDRQPHAVGFFVTVNEGRLRKNPETRAHSLVRALVGTWCNQIHRGSFAN